MAKTRIPRKYLDRLSNAAGGGVFREALVVRPSAIGKAGILGRALMNEYGLSKGSPSITNFGMGAFTFRRSTFVDALFKRSAVVTDEVGDQEFTAEIARWSTIYEIKAEYLGGSDCYLLLIDPDFPPLADEGDWCDAYYSPAISGTHRYVEQIVTIPGSATGTWTFSIYARKQVGFEKSSSANVRLQIGLWDGALASSEVTYTVPSNLPNGPVGWVRYSVTATFATALTQIRCRIRLLNASVGGVLSAAQLELAASPSAYQWTQGTAGSTNKLLWSHHPGRSATHIPSTTWTTGGGVVELPFNAPGPDIRALVPLPGTLGFSSHSHATGIVLSDATVEIRPSYPADNTGNRITSNGTANAAGVYQTYTPIDGVNPSNVSWSPSCWVRSLSANPPSSGVQFMVQCRQGGATLTTHFSRPMMLTRHWRRIWDVITPTYNALCDNVRIGVLAVATQNPCEYDAWGMQFEMLSGYPARIYVPCIDTGLFVSNWSFETWGGASDATGWTEDISGASGLTISQETVTLKHGTKALKASGKTAAGHNSISTQVVGLPTRAWQRFQIWVWANSNQTAGLVVTLRNVNTGRWCVGDGGGNPGWKTDGEGGGRFITANLVAGWNNIVQNYRPYTSNETGHTYELKIQFGEDATVTAGQIWILDAMRWKPHNNIEYSEDLTNGVWTKQQCTVAKDGYAPAREVRYWHPDTVESDLQVIAGGANTGDNTYNASPNGTGIWESSSGAGDGLGGSAQCIGAYGTDVLAGDGDFETWPGNWTVVGDASKAALAVSTLFQSDEVLTTDTVYALESSNPTGTSAWTNYVKIAKTLAVGWHTLVAASVYYASVRFKRVSDSFYLQADRCTWAAGVVVHTTNVDIFSFFVATAGSHELQINLPNMTGEGTKKHIDRLRLYSDAGQLFPSRDPELADSAPPQFKISVQGLYVLARAPIVDVLDGDETSSRLSIKGPFASLDVQYPFHKTVPECSWIFGEPDCGYVSTTTTTETITGTAVKVASVDDIEALRYYWIPRLNLALKCTVVDVGTKTLTFETSQTWQNGDTITYADCRRTRRDCDYRNRLFAFGGFPGVTGMSGSDTEEGLSLYRNATGPGISGDSIYRRGSWGKPFSLFEAPHSRDTFEKTPVPIAYGRTTVKAPLVEKLIWKRPSTGVDYVVGFYLIGEGPIENLRLLMSGDSFLTSITSAAQATIRGQDWHWYRGDPADPTLMTATDFENLRLTYDTPASPQWIDFRSHALISYGNRAYVVYYIGTTNSAGASFTVNDLPPVWADVKGRLVQLYDSAGNKVGSPVWSQNPAWCLLDFMTNKRFGLGFPASMIAWDRFYAASLICDQTITSAEAFAVCQLGGTSDYFVFDNTSGFAPEMTVSTPVGGKVVRVVDPATGTIFFTSSFTLSTGDTIQGTPKRYTLNLAMTQTRKASEWIASILDTFRARLVWDGGKVGPKIDVVVTSETQVTLNASLVIPDSVRFNQRRALVTGGAVNALNMIYTLGSSLKSDPAVTQVIDFGNWGGELPRFTDVSLPGCETAEQAMRCGLVKYARLAPVSTPSFQVQALPSAQIYQPGDRASLSAVGTGGPYVGRITRTTVEPDLSVQLSATPEATTISLDPRAPMLDIFSGDVGAAKPREGGRPHTEVTLTIAIVRQTGKRITFSITHSGFVEFPASSGRKTARYRGIYELHASINASFEPDRGPRGMGSTYQAMFAQTVSEANWEVPESLLEKTIYMKVLWRAKSEVGLSNEVTTIAYRTDTSEADPVLSQSTSPFNLVYGGDFDPDTQLLTGGSYDTDGTGKWISDSAATFGSDIDPTVQTADSSVGTGIGFASGANVWDENSGTTANRTLSPVAAETLTEAHIWDSFGTGTKDAKIKVEAYRNGTNATALSFKLQYATNKASPSWVDFATVTASAAGTTYESPVILGQNMANLAVRAPISLYGGGSGKTANGHVAEINAAERTSTTEGSVAASVGTLKGNGSSIYGNLRRRFPQKVGSSASATTMAIGSKHIVRMRVKATGTLTNPVLVTLYNETTGVRTNLMSVPAASITTSWQDFSIEYTPAIAHAGILWIEVRTLDTVPVNVDQVGVNPGSFVTPFQLSIEEISLGRTPDPQYGKTAGFSLGSWTLGLKKAVVS